MEKRYQVFVSSTYRDLKEERREVMQALLEMNCIPAGMELFPAADDDAWTLIKNVIAESDYYLVVVGGRYGATDTSGVSFTQREYEEAIALGVPVLPLLHGDPGKIPVDSADITPDAREKLRVFRQKLESKHHCKYWTSPEDLGGKVSRSLNLLIRTKPRTGWIRSDQSNPDLLGKLEQARQTIEKLEAELKSVSSVPPAGAEALAQGDDAFEMRAFVTPKHRRRLQTPAVMRLTWNELFRMVGPKLEEPVSESSVRSAVSNAFRRAMQRRQSREIRDTVSLDQDDFYMVLYQLLALGLVCQYEQPQTYGQPLILYGLTPYGRRHLFKLLAVRRTLFGDEGVTGLDKAAASSSLTQGST